MATDVINIVSGLSPDETTEMAKLCLCEMSDTTAVETIVEFIGGDETLRDELVANLENV